MRGTRSSFGLLCLTASVALGLLSSSGLSAQPIQNGWLAKFSQRGVSSSLSNASAATNPTDASPGIEGTWRTAGSFDSGGTDQALFTFSAGRNDGEGTVLHSDNLFFVAAPSCLTSQGVWRKAGDKTFIATDEAFCFDTTNNFAPAGTIRFRTAVTVGDKGITLTGKLHIDAFDTNGTLVFTDDGTIQGSRMLAVAPPGP